MVDKQQILEYWNNYYRNVEDNNHSSSFAKFCLNFVKSPSMLIDIGCGLGQDSLYFSNNKINVLGVDGSSEVINICERKSNECLTFQHLYFEDIESIKQKFSYFYFRFILHTVSLEIRRKLLEWAASNILENGMIFIETRSNKDTCVFLDNHERNFVDLHVLKEEILQLGFSIDLLDESRNFSPTENENPILIRLVATKTGEQK